MIIEVTGHRAGWLALYAGIAGGGAIPYDRVLATRFGTAAAELLCCGDYGKMVAREGNDINT